MTERLEAVTVSEATARLRVGADGISNWSKLFPQPAASAAPASPPVEPARWSLGALELEGGAIDYRDAAAGSQWQLTGIKATAEEVAPGAAFPLELQLGGLAGTNTVHFAVKGEGRLDTDAGQYQASALEYRGWLGGDPLPLAGAELTGTLREASYETGTGEARFAGGRFDFAEIPGRFDGRLELDEPAMVAEFDVATDAFAPRASAIIFGHPLPVTTDPAAFESLQLVFRARMQEGELALDPLSGRLDDTNFEGRVIPGRRFVRASLDSIDLNRYLPSAAKTAGTKTAGTQVRGHQEGDARSARRRACKARHRRGNPDRRGTHRRRQDAQCRDPGRAGRGARAVNLEPSKLAEKLLPWFDAHGRHDLPWQADPTPYRVWVSEVMLQQTQVETVKPYFERFIARFPDVTSLAAAPQDEVMRLWSGLGYYARARNLHRAAAEIVARHGSELPDSLDALMELPGIGRSTAGAILALARGQRHPILDGNVKRVLARVYLVEEAAESSAGLKKLWALSEAATPASRVAAYTQAMMDLGATICTRANPACDRCPLAQDCGAFAAGRQSTLPAARRRAPRRLKRTHMLFALSGGRVLLERRPPQGIWGGLWAPPEFERAADAEASLAARFGVAAPTRRLAPVQHAFTHFDLEIEPWIVELPAGGGLVAEGEVRWQDLASIEAVGLPAPVARLLEELRNDANGPVREARPRGGRSRETAVPG